MYFDNLKTYAIVNMGYDRWLTAKRMPAVILNST